MLIRLLGALWLALTLSISGCGGTFGAANSSSSALTATAEPAYAGSPTTYTDPITVTISAKFLYRKLDFTPGSSGNGLGGVSSNSEALPIPFAEFHIYDSSGKRVQQGETTTRGLAVFQLPKNTGAYTFKVFSRALNYYLKVSVLEDIYSNLPYSVAQSFTLTSGDIYAGTKDLSGAPVYAQANEAVSAKIEGAAFNIYYQTLIANEYVRRNIGKNGDTPGVPTTDTNKWWVADKVTIYWKAGFNPYTYFNSTAPLSFYAPGERKLYILGGVNGDVKSSDTDHFDDSIILHEYAHFLEDSYGSSASPGGSHNGDSVIDPRLAWSEGWANYFQSAVLTGADAYEQSGMENRIPSNKRYHYYVDTYGYKGGGTYGIGIAFNLAGIGTDLAEPDSVGTDSISNTGIFREVSISRTLYKSTRGPASNYAIGKSGGGVSFTNIWKSFAGEDTSGATSSNPVPYSLRRSSAFPLANAGLFNWLLSQNGAGSSQWNSILTEEHQSTTTQDYGFLLTSGSCTYTFSRGIAEQYIGSSTVPRSHQQINNDFYLYYHNGDSSTLSLSYSGALNLDLILYYQDYVYFEDTYWYAGQSSSYIAKQSRSATGTSESISLAGLPAGFYVLNVKINAYNKTNSQLNSAVTFWRAS